MSAKERAKAINNLFKYCKKEYQVITPPSDRPVLDHMVYACLLEDSTFDAADEAFAKLENQYFDWNEVRVTTPVELAEHFKSLKSPQEAAGRIRKALHGVFETYYSFEIDYLRKENLGKAVAQMSKFKGISPFVVSYTSQNALGGHSIPIDRAMLLLFHTLGIVSEADARNFKVTGLERVIPKSKGVEFFVLVHQFAARYFGKPFDKAVRDSLLKLAPDAKERFPKRATRKKAAAPARKSTAKKPTAAKKADSVTNQKSTKKPATKKSATKKPATKKKAVKKKAPAKKATVKKKPARKSTKKVVKKKPAKKVTRKKASSTRQLKKKKPR